MTPGTRIALDDILPKDGSLNADDAIISAAPTTIASRLPIADIAAAAYGALALAAARYAALTGGPALHPVVDRRLASLAMAGNEYLRIDGETPATWDPLTGYYRCGDGNYVYLHANFPHHRDGLLSLLETSNDRPSMTEALSRWSAADAEEAAQQRGLCCIMLRSRPEWEAHPQRAALAAVPPVRIAPLAGGAATPARTARHRTRPLEGVRVLDLSRVIAGPMAGRALAELGADVIRISAPGLPHIAPLVIDTGFDKRAAYVDLLTPAGCRTLRRLIRDADILIDGFRPGALAAKGFGTDNLTALNPCLTYVTLSAFSDVGPWAGRRGYDSYVQAGIGLTAPDHPGDQPVRLACQPLDYLTGCLSAYGAILGLIAVAEGRGGQIVETSLARTGMWLWEVSDRIGDDPAPPPRNPTFEEAVKDGFIREITSADHGHIAALAPPHGFQDRPLTWQRASSPLGADAPEWRQTLL
ncbi:MAG: CoA transferase [Pseudomonadota bacterium]